MMLGLFSVVCKVLCKIAIHGALCQFTPRFSEWNLCVGP